MLVQRLRFVSLTAVSLLALVGAGVAHAQAAVSVTAVEFAFQPSTLTVSPGRVTFTLRNGGQFPHNITIEGIGDVIPENVMGGQTASGAVTLAPGTYTFWCPVDAHRDRGMEGTLIVAGAGAARAGGFDPLMVSGALGALGAASLGLGLFRRRARA
jgi:plastocyanin